MTLYDAIKPYSVLSITGMSKNAGKTTALNAMIAGLYENGEDNFAITSIGRDGESTDVVTGTKKPSVYVYENTFVATAADMLPLCDITREILSTTGLYTPLGEVVTVKSKSDGYVQIAGPSTVEGLMRLCDMLKAFGAKRIIIDGAVSRKSLSTNMLSDGTVLCVGASYSSDMTATISDSAFVAGLYCLPADESFACRNQDEKLIMRIRGEYFPVDEQKKDALSKDVDALRVYGALTDSRAEAILRRIRNVVLVADDASKLLLSKKSFDRLCTAGIALRVERKTALAAITVNPFSARNDDYDKEKMLLCMQKAVFELDIPVFDVEELK